MIGGEGGVYERGRHRESSVPPDGIPGQHLLRVMFFIIIALRV